MYTVITKGNNVSKHNSIDSIERSVDGPFLAIDNGNGSKVAFTEYSPITWPDSATNGMKAIVDVKEGTLRFGYYDGWPRAHTEFVVSEYVEPFVSVEDSDPATVKQSAPKGKGNPILGMVLADLTNRALEGKEKYGEPLLANNGRNALWDAYQEALDLAMYLRQAIEEQERSC